MAIENKLQELIHRIEVGGWVRWIKATLVAVIVALLFSVVIFDVREWYSFCGLSHEKGIDQAQIARNLAEGKGFTTNFIRPAALAQFEKNKGSYPASTHFPDTFHAPLNIVVNAAILKTFNGIDSFLQKREGALGSLAFDKEPNRKMVVYPYDRILAAFSLLFFIASLPVWYFILRRLFDSKLATMATLLLVGCYRFWDFGSTGLPQNLMLLLFAGTIYSIIRATEKRVAGERYLVWLVLVGLGFGLLALANAITIWLFVGALVYIGVAFTPRPLALGVVAGVFLLLYTPWLVRNYKVCGDPMGISYYSALTSVRGEESTIFRSQDLEFKVSPTNFRAKVQQGLAKQLNDLYSLLGSIVAAPLFFLAMLHAFKKPETASLKWAVFSMWAFGALGMAYFGFNDLNSPYQANDLYLLFIPLMTGYGLAMILMLWTRLDIQVRLFRQGFIALIFAISLLPIANVLLSKRSKIQWPPYVPPWIAVLNEWTSPDEIIMSDMPWGVGWYANRVSLWLPMTIDEFLEMNDYQRKLSGKVVAMYLTPVTGNRSFIGDIVKGPYKEWAPFITRQVSVKDFPLKAVSPLPIDGECIIYADRERWRTSAE